MKEIVLTKKRIFIIIVLATVPFGTIGLIGYLWRLWET